MLVQSSKIYLAEKDLLSIETWLCLKKRDHTCKSHYYDYELIGLLQTISLEFQFLLEGIAIKSANTILYDQKLFDSPVPESYVMYVYGCAKKLYFRSLQITH